MEEEKAISKVLEKLKLEDMIKADIDMKLPAFTDVKSMTDEEIQEAMERRDRVQAKMEAAVASAIKMGVTSFTQHIDDQ